MKYLLINNKTKEEYFCDKITIEEFDYYISEKCNDLGGWHIDKEFKILSNISRFNVVTEMREVIATNNPDIGVPQIVNEVNELSLDEEVRTFAWANYYFKMGVKKGYDKSQETHPFNDKNIIEFLSFVENNYYFNSGCWINCATDEVTTRKELLQIWKEERIKIVYYE